MNNLQSLFNKEIILCSHSSRRKQILQDLGLKVIPTSVEVEESYPLNLPHKDIAEYLAKKKAAAYKETLQDNHILICADTLVLLGNDVLGKPKGVEDARRMLNLLSNHQHLVITGCVVKTNKKNISFSQQTKVFFKELSPIEIDYYINQYQPFDKAGAYGIQEWIGMIGIKAIEGDYYNVMGLPASKIFESLLSCTASDK